MTEAEQERAKVVTYLRDRALNDCPMPSTATPLWRHLLWALTHPIAWQREHARFFALVNAANAIERGKHIQETPVD